MQTLCLAILVLLTTACTANLSAEKIEAGYSVQPPRTEY